MGILRFIKASGNRGFFCGIYSPTLKLAVISVVLYVSGDLFIIAKSDLLHYESRKAIELWEEKGAGVSAAEWEKLNRQSIKIRNTNPYHPAYSYSRSVLQRWLRPQSAWTNVQLSNVMLSSRDDVLSALSRRPTYSQAWSILLFLETSNKSENIQLMYKQVMKIGGWESLNLVRIVGHGLSRWLTLNESTRNIVEINMQRALIRRQKKIRQIAIATKKTSVYCDVVNRSKVKDELTCQ